MATTNMPNSPDDFPVAPSFGSSGGVGFHSQWADLVGKGLRATQELALDTAATTVVRKKIFVSALGINGTNTGATNTFLFNSRAASEAGPCDWVFDAGVTYRTEGFQISHDYQRIVSSSGGYGSVVIDKSNNTGNAISFFVPATTYDERLRGCGMDSIKITNSGNTSGSAIYIRNMTHATFNRVFVSGFHGDGGGVNASDFADSIFFGTDFEDCGSFDDSDKAVLKFGNVNDNNLWNVDAIKFIGCRWEACGDRILDGRQGSGVGTGTYVNKIHFTTCKFENSSTSTDGLGGSASGAQFYLDNCGFINFTGCDFTLQGLRSGHAVLPTIFRLINTTWVAMSNCAFNFGAGALPKNFTNFFLLNGSDQLLSMDGVWINSGNSTAFPTNVISCTGSPHVSWRNCGFTPTQGTAKTVGDWITGTVNTGGLADPAVSGEANTTSNSGAGTGTLALPKSGVNLPFKTLAAGSGVSLTNGATTVTIAATGGGSGSPVPGAIYIEDFAGADDDAKLAAAMAYAAAQTYKPEIRLGFTTGHTSRYTFATAITPYTGFRLAGPGLSEQHRTGQPNPAPVRLNQSGAWLRYPSGSTFGTSVVGISFEGSGTNQWASSNPGVCWTSSFRDLAFTNFANVLGTPATKFLNTACDIFSGRCNINNINGTAITVGGSDSSFFTGMRSIIDTQPANITAAGGISGFYQIWFDSQQKSVIGPLYMTCQGASGIRVSGSSSFGLVFTGCVIEGQHDDANQCNGALFRHEGGNTVLRDICFNHAMINPAAGSNSGDTGVIMNTGGNLIVDGCGYARSTSPAVAETVKFIARTGGNVRVRNIRAFGTWTGLPRVTSAASVDVDNSVTPI